MNKAKPQLYTVVPVLNEEGNVSALLDAFANLSDTLSEEFDCRFLVIDDGSSDATAELLDAGKGHLTLTVLSHKVNRGPGAAFGTAFEYLASCLGDEDWVVTMEGDNTSKTDTLLQMLTRRKEGYDAVLASAYAYGGGMIGVAFNRVLLSHCANGLARLLLGLRGFHTLSSFFRLYNGSIIKKMQSHFGERIIECDGFECMVELLLKLVIVEATISEVETCVDWSNRKGGSKMRRVKAAFGYLRLLFVGWRWRMNKGKTFWQPLRRN